MTVTTTETRTEQIVGESLRWAEPVVSSIANETEIARLPDPTEVTDLKLIAYQRSNPESKAQMLPGLDALRAPKMRRSQMVMPDDEVLLCCTSAISHRWLLF